MEIAGRCRRDGTRKASEVQPLALPSATGFPLAPLSIGPVDAESAVGTNGRDYGIHVQRSASALNVGRVLADVGEAPLHGLGVEIEGLQATSGGERAAGGSLLREQVEAGVGGTRRREQWVQPIIACAVALHRPGLTEELGILQRGPATTAPMRDDEQSRRHKSSRTPRARDLAVVAELVQEEHAVDGQRLVRVQLQLRG